MKHVLSVSHAPPKAPLKLSLLHSIVFYMLFTDGAPQEEPACSTRFETYSRCVSLAPPRAPLKLSLLHSIVFHMLLRDRGESFEHAFFRPRFEKKFSQNLGQRKICLKFRGEVSVLGLLLRACEIPQLVSKTENNFFHEGWHLRIKKMHQPQLR